MTGISCDLYRCFDKDGRLLYVGISGSAMRRMFAHSRTEWSGAVAYIEIDRLSSRGEAERQEASAIDREFPLYNKSMHLHPLSVDRRLPASGAPLSRAEIQRRYRIRKKAVRK